MSRCSVKVGNGDGGGGGGGVRWGAGRVVVSSGRWLVGERDGGLVVSLSLGRGELEAAVGISRLSSVGTNRGVALISGYW